MARKRIIPFFIISCLLSSISKAGRSDDVYDFRQYQPPQQTYAFKPNIQFEPPPQNRFIAWFQDFFAGAQQGNAIEHPNAANTFGQTVFGVTPVGFVGDVRDFAIESYRGAKEGWNGRKTAIAVAAVGIIPAVSEVKGLVKAYKAEREGVLAARALQAAIRDERLVRDVLPTLKPNYAAEFEGMVRTRTFKAGDIVYRAPSSGAEEALSPGRWFGTRNAVTREGMGSMYQADKFGNKNEIIRAYEFKKDLTVYYGKVRGGTGYQVYIPDDINVRSIMKWVESRPLR